MGEAQNITHPFAGDARNHIGGDASGGLDLSDLLCPFFGQEGVGLVEGQKFGLVRKARAVSLELAANGCPSADHILLGRVDQVDQHSGALDMAKELGTKPGAIGSAFDQAGNIGQHEPFLR